MTRNRSDQPRDVGEAAMSDREELIEQLSSDLDEAFADAHGDPPDYTSDQDNWRDLAGLLADKGWRPAECAHCAALRQLNEISTAAQAALTRADQTVIMKPAQQEEPWPNPVPRTTS